MSGPGRFDSSAPRALDEACASGFRASTAALEVSKTHGDALRRPYMMCQAPGTSVHASSRQHAQILGYLQWINWIDWLKIKIVTCESQRVVWCSHADYEEFRSIFV